MKSNLKSHRIFVKNSLFEKIEKKVPPPEMDIQEKTPELKELEPEKKSLKIWAHNFEKQKS